MCWGTADFFGGLQARRLTAFTTTFWSQVAGGLALALVLSLVGGAPTVAALGWGATAGIFGSIALVLFYRGLAEGVMGIVAPVSACGAIVPVLVALVRGETPGAVTLVGLGLAIVGVALISLRADDAPSPTQSRGTLALASGAALGFGLFYVFADLGASAGASPLWAIAGSRVGSVVLLLGAMALAQQRAPWPGGAIIPLAGVGLLDTTANALYAFAASLGNLGVASVLGSLYPLATVLLARWVLAERLNRLQATGAAIVLAGVGLIAVG